MAGSRPRVPPPPIIGQRRLPPTPSNPIEELDADLLVEEHSVVEAIELGESAILAVESVSHRMPDALEPIEEPTDRALEALTRPAPPMRPSPIRATAVALTPIVTQPIDVQPIPTAKAAETVSDPAPSIPDIPPPTRSTLGPRPPRPEPRRPLEMSDVEALSTIDLRPDLDVADSTIHPFDTAMAMKRIRISPARIGAVSAVAAGLLVAVAHLWVAADANANAEIASERPVEVIHAAAVFHETDDGVIVPDQRKATEPVIDNERARKLGTLGLRAIDEGRHGTAKRLLDKALAANPHSRLALAGLGRYYLAKGNHRLAIEHLEQAVKIEPRKADNRRFLADAYAGLGSTGKARRHYERAARDGDAIAKQRLTTL